MRWAGVPGSPWPGPSLPFSLQGCLKPYSPSSPVGLLAAFVLPLLHTFAAAVPRNSSNPCSVTQSCPNLCNHMDCSLPGSSIHGIFQARVLEWGAISFSTSNPAATAAKSLQSCPDSVRPHRRQPTRLCHPWDSPGKNTGVGCHFLLQCMKVQSESEVAQL